MKNILLPCLIILIQIFAFGQETELPQLDTIWGRSEYQQVLKYLIKLKENGDALPKLDDKKSKDIFLKLTSYKNLEIYTDKSLTADQRFREVFPYFNLFSEILSIYSDAKLTEETVVICQFIMESTKMSTYLGEDKMKEWSKSKSEQFKASCGEQILNISLGSLEVISSASDDNVKKSYIVDFSNWFNKNFTVLYSWMNEEGKRKCKSEIDKISKNHIIKDVRIAMKDLNRKI